MDMYPNSSSSSNCALVHRVDKYPQQAELALAVYAASLCGPALSCGGRFGLAGAVLAVLAAHALGLVLTLDCSACSALFPWPTYFVGGYLHEPDTHYP